MDERDLLYAGGIFDGEGSIYYCKQPTRTGAASVFLTVSFVNTDQQTVEWFARVFGGKCYLGRETRDGRKPIYRVRWQSAQAVRVLQQITPYLRIKQGQAEEALAFEASRMVRPGQHAPLTTEESARRLEFHRSWQQRYGQPKSKSLSLVTMPV